MGTATSTARLVMRAASAAPAPVERTTWWRSTWALAFAGQLLFWAALPPLGWWPLAWLAPVPWVLLIRQQSLVGRRPYRTLYFTSFAFCLAALHWMTLPHWATSIGWIALSFYLGWYFPLFIALSRYAVHRLHVSPIVAAPVIWVGLELAQAHLLTGFLMAALSNTQYHWPLVLQVSDLFGSYGVSFLIVLVAACAARCLKWNGVRGAWWPLLPLAAAFAGALAYGHWRMSEETTKPGPVVALIQGSIDIEMKHDPKEGQKIFDEYFGLSKEAVSKEAVSKHGEVDLIVWPETMFRYPWFTFDKDFHPPAGAKWTTADAEETSRRAVRQTVEPLGVPLLLGIDVAHETTAGTKHYNAALLVDPDGKLLGRYDKCHPVLFGEYVPFASMFPWLYQLTPLSGGLESGDGPQSIQVGAVRYAPSICYENTLPHLIRQQVSTLREAGNEPDVLVNLTNDGWFWGSAELDMHLACAVLRAVECRKPMLIAANTGFSAWIDSQGQIQAQGRRRATDTIIAQSKIDRRRSWYTDYGDLPAGACLTATIGLAVAALWDRRKQRQVATA